MAALRAAEENGGNITAQMDGTVTRVQLEAGQRSGESAAFFMSGASGGMSFTTEITREEAVYVAAGDTATLRAAGEEYEELSVVSVESGESEETVMVTVFVPEGTIAPGEYAEMEVTKSSEEYAVILPISAVRTENEQNFVYMMALEETVLGKQYVAKRVDVSIAERNEAAVALESADFPADGPVIVSADRILSEGERVRLEEDDAP